MHVAVIYSKGPAWTSREAAKDHIEAHKAFQHKNFEAGLLLMGGPFLDEAGGMALLEVGSRQQAENVVGDDPAIKGGFYSAKLHPWRIVVSRAKGV